jgi:hypothetical protein
VSVATRLVMVLSELLTITEKPQPLRSVVVAAMV